MKHPSRIASTLAIALGADAAETGGMVAVRKIETQEMELGLEMRLIEIRIEIKRKDLRKKEVVNGEQEEVVTDLRARAIARQETERDHLKRVSPLSLVILPRHPPRETVQKSINSELIR